jgi:hypothetical protein
LSNSDEEAKKKLNQIMEKTYQLLNFLLATYDMTEDMRVDYVSLGVCRLYAKSILQKQGYSDKEIEGFDHLVEEVYKKLKEA